MLHKFKIDIQNIDLPKRFTNPFSYIPHELSILAYNQLQQYVSTQLQLYDELSLGKMFGVLVVRDVDGGIGFVAAFSGNLEQSNTHDYFVPPIYDLMRPDGFFKTEESAISSINRKIDSLSSNATYIELKKQYIGCVELASNLLEGAKLNILKSKKLRDELRKNDLSDIQMSELQRESQHLKADLKRLKDKNKIDIDTCKSEVDKFEIEILELKQERKRRSMALQMRLFDSYQILNSKGEIRGLSSIFEQTPQKIPPAGAGECAAPKLLQYAYLNGLTPLTMAEFWCGASPKTEVRHHGQFYTACRGKCLPILSFMLEDHDLEDEIPYCSTSHTDLTILYEDDWFFAVEKPCGLLSVDGKLAQPSVISILLSKYPLLKELMLIHRLDMDTSGVLLVAKNIDTYKAFQNEFKNHRIKKKYVALLDGLVKCSNGEITLPLSANYIDRPRQMIDFENGKSAVTKYKIIRHIGQTTLIEFFPLTGRTHQLRLHSASVMGLNMPIVGDRLYGSTSDRMYLHAQSVEFCHPHTNVKVVIDSPNIF